MFKRMPPVPRRRKPVSNDRRSALRSAQRDLASLAEYAEKLAAELAARGPHPPVGGLAGRARRWRTEVQDCMRALRLQRRSFLRPQLRRLQLDAERRRGLRLHLGSADLSLPGWINIDRWPAELSMDLRWGLPFADGVADAVYLCHVLEHFYYPEEALAVLRDIRRVLAPQGVLRVVVPDIGRTLRAYVAHDRRFFAARRAQWPWWPRAQSQLEEVLGYAGVAAAPGTLGGHRFGYDFETLRALLRTAGFRRIARSGYLQSRHRALRIDDTSHVARARCGRRYLSLFVEAALR